MSTSVKTYSLSPEGIELEKRKAAMRGIFTALLGIAIGLGIPIVAGLVSLWVLIIVIPIFLLAFGFGARRGYGILQERWASFQIILSPEFIIRKQSGIPDIEIDCEQVRHIQEKPSGVFVRTAEKHRYIHVPKGLEGYEEAKLTLEQWRNIEKISPTKDYVPAVNYLLLILFAISFGVIFLSQKIWLVISAGMFIILYTLWGQINLRRNAQVDARVKFDTWRMLLVILIMIVIVAGRIYVVLSK